MAYNVHEIYRKNVMTRNLILKSFIVSPFLVVPLTHKYELLFPPTKRDQNEKSTSVIQTLFSLKQKLVFQLYSKIAYTPRLFQSL